MDDTEPSKDLYDLLCDPEYIAEFGEIIGASLNSSGGLQSKDVLLERLKCTIIDLDVISPKVEWTSLDIARIKTAAAVLTELLPENYRES